MKKFEHLTQEEKKAAIESILAIFRDPNVGVDLPEHLHQDYAEGVAENADYDCNGEIIMENIA